MPLQNAPLEFKDFFKRADCNNFVFTGILLGTLVLAIVNLLYYLTGKVRSKTSLVASGTAGSLISIYFCFLAASPTSSVTATLGSFIFEPWMFVIPSVLFFFKTFVIGLESLPINY